jgi:hypothetical protein
VQIPECAGHSLDARLLTKTFWTLSAWSGRDAAIRRRPQITGLLGTLQRGQKGVAFGDGDGEVGMAEHTDWLYAAKRHLGRDEDTSVTVGREGESSIAEREMGRTGRLHKPVRAGNGYIGDVLERHLCAPRTESRHQSVVAQPDIAVRRCDAER